MTVFVLHLTLLVPNMAIFVLNMMILVSIMTLFPPNQPNFSTWANIYGHTQKSPFKLKEKKGFVKWKTGKSNRV